MKKIITICCTSFTSVILLFLLLYQYDVTPELSPSIIIQVFLMSVLIALLMHVSDRVQKKYDIGSLWLDLVVRILICYFSVFAVGCIGGMFPFGLRAIVKMTPVLILAFIITYIISYAACVNYANEINSAIKKKKE